MPSVALSAEGAEVSEYAVFATIAVASVSVVGALIGAVLWLNKREKAMNEHADAHFQNVQHDIHQLELTLAKSRSENVSGDDIIRREFGEVAHAIRAKVHDLELHVRDNFVSKPTFEAAVNRIERSVETGIKDIKQAMDKTVERIERRLDKG